MACMRAHGIAPDCAGVGQPISQFQTRAALIATGRQELEHWLRRHRVRHADKLATAAIRAA
jgi:hypothetical protein